MMKVTQADAWKLPLKHVTFFNDEERVITCPLRLSQCLIHGHKDISSSTPVVVVQWEDFKLYNWNLRQNSLSPNEQDYF
jgi:hypothetical protein